MNDFISWSMDSDDTVCYLLVFLSWFRFSCVYGFYKTLVLCLVRIAFPHILYSSQPFFLLYLIILASLVHSSCICFLLLLSHQVSITNCLPDVLCLSLPPSINIQHILLGHLLVSSLVPVLWTSISSGVPEICSVCFKLT